MELDLGAPLTRSTPDTTVQQLQHKRSFLSKLRRTPSSVSTSTSPYGQPIHAASTSAVVFSSTRPVSTVKKNQVGVPIMMVNRSEEIFGPSTSIKHGFGIEDELEWERVRTLPRVRLVPPPEEQTEPIMLYPPPRLASPPPTLPHPFLSAPSSPPTSPPRLSTRPGSPPQSPPRRPQSIYSQSPTWAGMADGFVLPPPKFSRNSTGWSSTAFGGGNVVMPKRREQVDEDRRKRISEYAIGSPPRSPPAIVVSGMMRSLESQEEIAANKRMRVDDEQHEINLDERRPQQNVLDDEKELTASPIDMDIDQIPTPPSVPDVDINIAQSAPVAAIPLRSTTVPAPQSSDTPTSPSKTPVPKAIRRSRALSLSAAFSSSSGLKNVEVPPLPDLPSRPPIRKQKSLKKFFFSSSTPPEAVVASSSIPPVPAVPLQERKPTEDNQPVKQEKEKPSKGKKILQRARSKPSLKIDVKVAKPSSPSTSPSPTTPALTTGKTDISTSSSITTTPSSAPAQLRGLSKRFSLSNMSQAFKKKSHSTPVSATASFGSPVPMVPDIPEAFKKNKDSKDIKAKGKGKAIESASPISPRKSKTLDTDNNDEMLTPTGLPRRSESLKAIQSLTFCQEDESNVEGLADHTNIISTENVITDEPQSLLPAFEVSSDTQALSSPVSASVPRSGPSSESPIQSVKSISTVDIDDVDIDIDIEEEDDEHELAHAQLMHVSPRTRRDPSQSLSLQEFLSSPPGKTSNIVIVPTKGLRRSVEAVVMLGNPMMMNLQSPLSPTDGNHVPNEEDREADGLKKKDKKRESKLFERRGSETESEAEELKTPLEESSEIFPNQPDLVQEDEEPTPKASSSRTTSEEQQVRVEDDCEYDYDLESLPSDTVLVETPSRLPAVPHSSETSTITNATPVNTKNRFVSPEALLKRLHSSRRPNQATPYQHNKKGSASKDRESLILLRDIPLPPLPASDSKEFSSLSKEMQLRSLKFESLGLDFQQWDEWSEEDIDRLIMTSEITA
ncbi:hypothetical protein I203_107239 [Kwoniella mangroviensis CBS 8507]|uniref:hypothetical protein n=1 Tax=Kwoniella mangroviensis CBS 8507 TaxID=1296122 RepID=UPI00080CC04F|nr:uncharacterized protein I203_01988 [Kwoniella mangroviensis CBS 8507]OCF68605.1 hypothetical protein I203_01988 [Kwoniella mangroviensis CBS 8507]